MSKELSNNNAKHLHIQIEMIENYLFFSVNMHLALKVNGLREVIGQESRCTQHAAHQKLLFLKAEWRYRTHVNS